MRTRPGSVRFLAFPSPLCKKGLHALDHLGRLDLQHLGQLDHRPDSWASDSPFDQTDVRAVETGFKSQSLLREIAALPDFPQALTERLLRAGDRLDLLLPLCPGSLGRALNLRCWRQVGIFPNFPGAI